MTLKELQDAIPSLTQGEVIEELYSRTLEIENEIHIIKKLLLARLPKIIQMDVGGVMIDGD